MKHKISILVLLALTANSVTVGVQESYLDKLRNGGISQEEFVNTFKQEGVQQENSKPTITRISDEDFLKLRKNDSAVKEIDLERINQIEEETPGEQDKTLDKLRNGGIAQRELIDLLKQQPKKEGSTFKVINSKVRININEQ